MNGYGDGVVPFARDLRDWRQVSNVKVKMNTEVRKYDEGERDRSEPLPDYDHRTRLLVVGAVVLDQA